MITTDVALGWSHAGALGGAVVDPDLAAAELRRQERSRLSSVPCFCNLLKQLSDETRWRNGIERPIFLLPVDDIDLNPGRCLEMLRLIRAIGSAHLLVIVLGDLGVARLVLQVGFLGEFASLESRASSARVRGRITSRRLSTPCRQRRCVS